MISTNLFSILIGLASFIGLWRIYANLSESQTIKGLTLGLWVLFGGLIGARAGYVLLHASYFSTHFPDWFKFWLGGLNGFGGYTGAVLFVLAAVLLFHLPLLKTIDLASNLLLPLGAAAWLGSWAEGAAYGKTLEPGTWWGMMTLDEMGVVSLRVPLQIVAAVSLVILLLVIERSTKKAENGVRFAFMGLGFTLHTFLSSFFRDDPIQTVFRMRLDSILFLGSALCFVILLAFLLWWKKDTMKPKKSDDCASVIIER